ncbi:uncharacterized protein ARMOST_19634 [Armillaria ostoyae]|uniref:F-box domain-containing protein n=1 Tax=Armillaria ostoyae TaxID=47428 RepID=A0A284S531_ARMOS|nr:uncharacterized protein ARMOST_19634 [Armillaria ostoyae]
MSCRYCGFIDGLSIDPQPPNTKTSDSLVSQILRRQRPLLDSDHALLNADIVELERLQSLYAVQLQEIQLRRRAVLKALENRKAIYAPVRRLPRDILIEIFHLICDSWWKEKERNGPHSLDVSGPLWVLGRVCGTWRDTLHSSPASWARKLVVRAFFSKYALELLHTYLEHTGEHRLNLQIFCSNAAGDDKILSLLVQSSQRWKNLSINAAKLHMPFFESISSLPALQTIDIVIYDDYGPDYRSDLFLSAPQLWRASLHRHGIHQIRLLSGITHFSGTITCPEDLRLLAELPNLRRCHLWMRMTTKKVPVVTVAQLTHLYVESMNILNVLSAPLLNSLTIDPVRQAFYSSTEQESLARFLHRSRCHLESLSIGKAMFISSADSSIFALEACSTVSRLKLELPPWMISSVVEALTSPSVLPNLHHLILCLSEHSEDQWDTILDMVRSRRDTGMLKSAEVQSEEEGFEYFWDEDMRALTRDDFEMRVAKWDPPCQDHRYLLGMF